MVSKYPCCSDCGTKLDFQYSNIHAPNEFRVNMYGCKKCGTDIVRVKKIVDEKDLIKYNTFVAEFVFKNLAWK